MSFYGRFRLGNQNIKYFAPRKFYIIASLCLCVLQYQS